MISHPWRRQGCCSSCIRFRTASRDRCVAARVMRFPIRLTSFPYHDSFLEYHTECKCVGNLCTQPLRSGSLHRALFPVELFAVPWQTRSMDLLPLLLKSVGERDA